MSCVTDDPDEKEGVSAAGWETAVLLITTSCFGQGSQEGCNSTFLQYFGPQKNAIKLITNKLRGKLNNVSDINGTYI